MSIASPSPHVMDMATIDDAAADDAYATVDVWSDGLLSESDGRDQSSLGQTIGLPAYTDDDRSDCDTHCLLFGRSCSRYRRRLWFFSSLSPALPGDDRNASGGGCQLPPHCKPWRGGDARSRREIPPHGVDRKRARRRLEEAGGKMDEEAEEAEEEGEEGERGGSGEESDGRETGVKRWLRGPVGLYVSVMGGEVGWNAYSARSRARAGEASAPPCASPPASSPSSSSPSSYSASASAYPLAATPPDASLREHLLISLQNATVAALLPPLNALNGMAVLLAPTARDMGGKAVARGTRGRARALARLMRKVVPHMYPAFLGAPSLSAVVLQTYNRSVPTQFVGYYRNWTADSLLTHSLHSSLPSDSPPYPTRASAPLFPPSTDVAAPPDKTPGNSPANSPVYTPDNSPDSSTETPGNTTSATNASSLSLPSLPLLSASSLFFGLTPSVATPATITLSAFLSPVNPYDGLPITSPPPAPTALPPLLAPHSLHASVPPTTSPFWLLAPNASPSLLVASLLPFEASSSAEPHGATSSAQPWAVLSALLPFRHLSLLLSSLPLPPGAALLLLSQDGYLVASSRLSSQQESPAPADSAAASPAAEAAEAAASSSDPLVRSTALLLAQRWGWGTQSQQQQQQQGQGVAQTQGQGQQEVVPVHEAAVVLQDWEQEGQQGQQGQEGGGAGQEAASAAGAVEDRVMSLDAVPFNASSGLSLVAVLLLPLPSSSSSSPSSVSHLLNSSSPPPTSSPSSSSSSPPDLSHATSITILSISLTALACLLLSSLLLCSLLPLPISLAFLGCARSSSSSASSSTRQRPRPSASMASLHSLLSVRSSSLSLLPGQDGAGQAVGERKGKRRERCTCGRAGEEQKSQFMVNMSAPEKTVSLPSSHALNPSPRPLGPAFPPLPHPPPPASIHELRTPMADIIGLMDILQCDDNLPPSFPRSTPPFPPFRLSRLTPLPSASHELRTPMAGIIGLMDILQCDDNLTADQLDIVAQIHRCAMALLGILNNILDLSKVEAGKLELAEERFNPARELEGLVDLFAVQCASSGLDIALDLDGAYAWRGGGLAYDLSTEVIGDAPRFRQIFANLLSNAIKFTPQGWITIRGYTQQLGAYRSAADLIPTPRAYTQPEAPPGFGFEAVGGGGGVWRKGGESKVPACRSMGAVSERNGGKGWGGVEEGVEEGRGGGAVGSEKVVLHFEVEDSGVGACGLGLAGWCMGGVAGEWMKPKC
ncbi:unnamed protein product [Closterium sp. NIES-54]